MSATKPMKVASSPGVILRANDIFIIDIAPRVKDWEGDGNASFVVGDAPGNPPDRSGKVLTIQKRGVRMSSLHVTITTNAGAGAAGAGANPTDLAGLQKKLTGLMKELEKVSKDMSPGAKERIKLLQVQIQNCEMQIQQLQAAEAREALTKQAGASSGQEGADGARAVHGPVGNIIDTKA